MVFANLSLTLNENKFRVPAYQSNDGAKKRFRYRFGGVILIWTRC